jgi:hypothetical protein
MLNHKKRMMKYIVLQLLISVSLSCFSQSDEQVKQLIFQKDSLFWVAYNKCDVTGMGSVLTDDVEFYHDKGGPSISRDTLMGVMKKNLCGNDNFRLRRAAVKNSVNVFVMRGNDKVYAAIISGEHVFFVKEKDKKEYLDGRARFTQLWVLKDGQWKMSRILSFDHHEAPKDTEVQ